MHYSSEKEFLIGYLPIDRKKVDLNLWRWKSRGEYDAIIPRRDTKEGRALYKEFEKLPGWNTRELAEKVGWKMLHYGATAYFLGFFHYQNGFAGIRVPIFDNEDYKDHPDLRYKPVKGMKEISCKLMQKKSAMTSKEYLKAVGSKKPVKLKKKLSPMPLKKFSKNTSKSLSARMT